MQAIMITIHPHGCSQIISGSRTIEIRKTAPKLETPFKCYIYMTKNKGGEHGTTQDATYIAPSGAQRDGSQKIVGEFVCDNILKYEPVHSFTEKAMCISLKMSAGMTAKEVWDYSEHGAKTLYGFNIKNLKLYENPKEIGDFKVTVTNQIWQFTKKLERPPINWGYVEELKGE